MQSEQNIIEEYQHTLFNTIIENKIRLLLEIINKNYPNHFKQEFINSELQYIIKHIQLKPYINEVIPEPIHEPIPEPIPDPIPIQKNNIIMPKKLILINKYKKQIPEQKQPLPSSPPPPLVLPDNNCCGRIWNNYIIERTTMTKIKNIPDSFKVSDFKDINIKKFNAKYIIGSQCKKTKFKDSEYCKLHTNHLIHGNYKEPPSQEICYHFMKDGKYL